MNVDPTATLIWAGNLIFGMVLGRPRPGVRLGIGGGVGFFSTAGGGFRSYNAVIFVHAVGRSQLTVREAGWIAADGHEVKGHLRGERTLTVGGPELEATADAKKLMEVTRQNRGLSKVYVTIVGRDKRFTFPIDNTWRGELIEAVDKYGSY